MNNTCEVYAHRGGAGLFPENTLPAYRNALELDVDVLDLDVAITKDNVIVASHDSFLNSAFTRDAQGQWLTNDKLLIKNFTFDELQQFDVGRLNPANDYAKLYLEQQAVDGTHIPSVQQIIDLARSVGKINFRLQIEIKTNPTEPEMTATPEQFMQRLYELLEENNCLSQVEVHSFDWRNMLFLQQLNQDIKTSYITSEQDPLLHPNSLLQWHGGYDVRDYQGSYPQLIAKLGGKIWCPDYRDVTPEQVNKAHQLGLRVTSWTADSIANMDFLLKSGVDGIITNRPDKLIRLLDPKAEI